MLITVCESTTEIKTMVVHVRRKGLVCGFVGDVLDYGPLDQKTFFQ